VDLAVEFKIKPNCKNHEPYPKGMCSQCIPPSINVRQQEYRHVDYAEFMNFQEISRFIKNWLETGFQRVGVLYGYYAEDPVYEKGVRAIVEVLYEPPQENKYNETILLDDPAQIQLEQIINNLGFERLGFVFTTFNKSAFLTSHEFLRAAQLQERYGVNHPIGMKVSKQVTLVLRGELISRPRKE
jgi:nuclear protein localization family protein 4